MDDHYWMYVYKVAKCPAKERHDWSACPYAHRGERAARRCPQNFSYSAEPCPEYSKKGTCPQGDACPLAHSVFESWLHPSRFRTQLCCFGPSCRRRICFFAHNAAQLRAATASGAPGGPVMRRTQAVVPASALAMPAASAAAASALQATGTLGIPAAAAPMAAGMDGGYPATAVLQGQPLGMVPGMPMASSGWVLTGQGWAPASYFDPSAAGAGSSAAAAAAQQASMAQHNMAAAAAAVAAGAGPSGAAAAVAAAAAAAEVANLAMGFEGLVLQADAQLPTSPAQQTQQAVLQGVTYLAGLPAAGGVAGTSQSGSYGYISSDDAVGDSRACLPSGAGGVSGSGLLVAYGAPGAAVVTSLPAMALNAMEQQNMQDLQRYQQQQQQHAQLQQQSRHGPHGW